MIRLSLTEIGTIFGDAESVATTLLMGHEKIGTIALCTTWLSRPVELSSYCGLLTLAMARVTGNYTSDNKLYLQIVLSYLQRFIDDERLVEQLNQIKEKQNNEIACTVEEETTYQTYKTLVNRRIDVVTEQFTHLDSILQQSLPTDPLLMKKVASLYNIDYYAPSPGLWQYAKAILFPAFR